MLNINRFVLLGVRQLVGAEKLIQVIIDIAITI